MQTFLRILMITVAIAAAATTPVQAQTQTKPVPTAPAKVPAPAVTATTPAPTTPTATTPAPVAPAATPKAALIDINSASEADLIAGLYGIGPARAKAIIAGRPYKGKDDLVARKIITAGIYDGIKDKIIAKQK